MNCFTRVFPVYTLGVANTNSPNRSDRGPERLLEWRPAPFVDSLLGLFGQTRLYTCEFSPDGREIRLESESRKFTPVFWWGEFLPFWKASVSSVKMRIFPKWKWKLHEIALKWKNIQGLCQLWFDSTKETTWDSNVQHRPGRSPSMCSLLREGNSFTLQGG